MPKPIEAIDIGLVDPEELTERARERGIFVFDLETTGLSPRKDHIEGVAFYVPPDPVTRLGDPVREPKPELRAWYPFAGDTFRTWVQPDESPEEQAARLDYKRCCKLPTDSDTILAAKAAWMALRQKPKVMNLRPRMSQSETMEKLRPLFEQSPGTVCVAHNLKFDYGFMRHASGCEVGYWERSCVDRLAAIGRGDIDPGPKECGGLLFADSMLADFLCDENYYQYGLKRRTKELFGHEMTTYKDVMRHRKQGTLSFMADEEGADSLGHYAMEDCFWTWRLFEDRMRELDSQTPGPTLDVSANAVDQLADVARKKAPISPFDPTRRMGNLERIFWGIDMRVCLLLEEMESTGILIDWEWLQKVTARLENQKDEIIGRIEKRIGWTLNPNSQAQVAALLFSPKDRGGLGLSQKGIKRGKTGAISTGSKEISHLKRADPLVADVLDWRSKDTIQANFSVKLAKIAQAEADCRIYSHFNQTGTKIFRLSSSNPVNLQNQPRDDELIRKAFCARLPDPSEEHFKKLRASERRLYEQLLTGKEIGELLDDPMLQLYSADYSQIELRVAAHLSGDKGMIEVYRTGHPCTRADGGGSCERYQWWECGSKITRDDGTESKCKHTWVPAQWKPKEPGAPTRCPKCNGEKIEHQKRCRHVDLHTRTAEDANVPRNPLAKNLNFGVLYRIGAPRFCQYADLFDEHGDPRVEYAEGVIKAWFAAYPAIHPFHVLTEKKLRRDGWYACTITGRRRRLDRERWKNEYRAITQGIQFQVSGSAQDILKRAMIDIAIDRERRIANARPAERRLWRKTKLILQVHDEITYVGPTCLEDEIIPMINTGMEGAANLKVPIPADCKSGRTWQGVH